MKNLTKFIRIYLMLMIVLITGILIQINLTSYNTFHINTDWTAQFLLIVMALMAIMSIYILSTFPGKVVHQLPLPTTIGEWFEHLPPLIRDRAIRNTEKDILTKPAKSLKDALSQAFYWRNTPEGAFYWETIFDEL